MVSRDMKAQAVACLRAAIEAVEPSALVAEALRGSEESWSRVLASAPVHVLAVGKAAPAMVRGAVSQIGAVVAGGMIVAPRGYPVDDIDGLETLLAEHPVPGRGSLDAGRRVAVFASGLPRGDHLLCLISGGGSSLLALPAGGLSLDDLSETTRLLLEAGATIGELNTVRKHLDGLKGGRLARLLQGVDVRALVLSDVVGDPLDVIASGPLAPDSTTYAEAVRVLEAKRVFDAVPQVVKEHLRAGQRGALEETPSRGHPCFAKVETSIVGNAALAARAAAAAAERLGYASHVLTTELVGEARRVGGELATTAIQIQDVGSPVAPPVCLVAAGETTVTVVGDGRGGRNHELALGAAMALGDRQGIVVGSVGTDGIDGSSSAAGAVAGPDSLDRADALGLDPKAVLADNDTHHFFDALGDAVITGATGTNVGDVQVVLVADSGALSG